jgi:hypothetical protein
VIQKELRQVGGKEYQTKRLEIVCLHTLAEEFVTADSEGVADGFCGSADSARVSGRGVRRKEWLLRNHSTC